MVPAEQLERTEIIGSVTPGPDWQRRELTYAGAAPTAPIASLAFWVDGSVTLDGATVRQGYRNGLWA